MAKLVPAGKHGVVELNHVAAVKTGEIIAQYNMAVETLDNGWLVAVDHVKKEVKLPAITDTVYLVASEEKLYDTREGREDFVNKKDSFGVRLYKLAVGDIFETNAVDLGDLSWDTAKTEIANGTKYYGMPSTTGEITLTKTEGDFATCLVVLQAVEAVILPNGRKGFKFVVVKGL